MKNIISIFIVMIVTTVFFSGCKKYEEDPALTLRSVKNRLTNGDWELENLTIDGEDSTADYSEMDFNYHIYTSSQGLGSKTYEYTQTYTYNGDEVETDGYIYFTNDGETISFQPYSYGYSNVSPLFSYSYNGNSSYIEWDIIKLTNKEFWLESTYDGMKVSMKLTKNK